MPTAQKEGRYIAGMVSLSLFSRHRQQRENGYRTYGFSRPMNPSVTRQKQISLTFPKLFLVRYYIYIAIAYLLSTSVRMFLLQSLSLSLYSFSIRSYLIVLHCTTQSVMEIS